MHGKRFAAYSSRISFSIPPALSLTDPSPFSRTTSATTSAPMSGIFPRTDQRHPHPRVTVDHAFHFLRVNFHGRQH